MKKKVLLFSILIIFLISFTIADNHEECDENCKVDKAQDCLKEKVEDSCSSLSLEERIFSLLAIGDCKSEVQSDSRDDECWPSSNCNLKSTSQAVLALDNAGGSINDAIEWIISQNTTPTDLDWLLQIESSEKTTCTISYEGSSYSVEVGDDKKVNSGAGNCLTSSDGRYWLKVNPTCYDNEFEISCDKSFLTSLLFKKTTSSTIHVSEETSSAAAEGTTTEKVDSLCFAQGGSCNYEGSLWSALVLDFLDYDVSHYMPYLVTMADDEENLKFIPEAFLYFLTGYPEYRNDLLLKQKSSKWWMESGDKFYDTAVALYPFQHEEAQEKTNTINWLLEAQDSNGCWDNGNVKSTAFILHSIWAKGPLRVSGGGSSDIDCEDAGYNCMSGGDCPGQILEGYSCSVLFKCCDKPKSTESCNEQGGEICNSNQDCIDGRTENTYDLESGQDCCFGGYCGEPIEGSECATNFGICKVGCAGNEEESLYSCDFSTDTCCIQKTSTNGNYFWIWFFLILIILVIFGIIFRDRLRPFWHNLKSKFDKFKSGVGRGKPKPGHPPTHPQQRHIQRKIFPQSHRPPVRRAHPVRKSGELDEVLKKLKDMGK
tara:strand:- start:1940 stop:3736 length:1797 start_codon:yes stop_codon:yes gene_type:complete